MKIIFLDDKTKLWYGGVPFLSALKKVFNTESGINELCYYTYRASQLHLLGRIVFDRNEWIIADVRDIQSSTACDVDDIYSDDDIVCLDVLWDNGGLSCMKVESKIKEALKGRSPKKVFVYSTQSVDEGALCIDDLRSSKVNVYEDCIGIDLHDPVWDLEGVCENIKNIVKE